MKEKTSLVFTGDIGFDRYFYGKWDDENGNIKRSKEEQLKLFNENNEEMVKATGLLDSLQPGESKDLTISITSDYIHACGYSLVEK